MITLSSTQKLQLTASPILTSQAVIVAAWVDYDASGGTFTPGSTSLLANGATAVDVVASPGAGVKRQVKFLSVYNADVGPQTHTVIFNDGGTQRTLIAAAVQIGGSLEYNSESGFSVFSTTGSVTQNYVYAGPSGVSPGTPTFRALVLGDLPANIDLSNLASRARWNINQLINGAHDVNQRVNSCGNGSFVTIASLVLGTDKYADDRWKVAAETAAATKAQRTDTNGALESGLNARYYLTLQANGTGKMCAYQILEGINTLPFASRSVVFQCKLKASSNKTLRLGLVQLNSAGTIDTFPTMMSAAGANSTDPTLGANLAKITPDAIPSGANGSIVGSGVNCSATTNWQLFAGKFTMPSNMKNVAVAVWTDSQFALNDTFSVSEAQFVDGDSIRDWLPRPIAEEKVLAQRYFSKSFPENQGPVQNNGNNTGETYMIAGHAGATTNWWEIVFPVVMRSAPNVTLYNPAVANAQIRDQVAGADLSGSTVSAPTDRHCQISGTGNASTAVGNICGVHWSADAEL